MPAAERRAAGSFLALKSTRLIQRENSVPGFCRIPCRPNIPEPWENIFPTGVAWMGRAGKNRPPSDRTHPMDRENASIAMWPSTGEREGWIAEQRSIHHSNAVQSFYR
jgi:hypothetical protein